MRVKLNKNQKITVTGSEDIYLIMRQILLRENKIRQSQEHFWIVGLNQANKIHFIELVALGSSNRMKINPREAFRIAIHKLAVKVILIHNHPGGEVEPSDADLDFTDHFIQVGIFLNIKVMDHLIITEVTYHSLRDSGNFALLLKSKKWVLPFEIEEKAMKKGIKKGKKEGIKEGIVKGKEEGKLEEKIEMARSFKQQNVDISIIVNASGLSKEEIEKL